MSNSKLRKKFVFLKQILEEATSDKSTDSSMESHHSEEETAKKIVPKSAGSSAGPAGRYPVKFGASYTKSKGCQTRLSSFPLFPVPEEIMWISDGEDRSKERRVPRAKKKKRQGKDAKKSVEPRGPSVKDGELTQSLNCSRSPVRNPDGARADFHSEHQLKDSSNPAILAWVHRKNIHARKKRREERQERRAKRLVLEEESRMKSERLIESEGKVREWFKIKRRHTWRSNRSKVSPHNGRVSANTDKASPPPPPGYTVVKSFKCSGNYKESPLNEQNVLKHSALASESNYTKTASVKPEEKELDGSKRPNSSVSVRHHQASLPPRPNTSTVRPKTARERMSKPSPQSVKANNENQSPSKMQSMSYDEWLKNKREEDRRQKTRKERELIDSHLEAVIAELGKQRVERILSPRKRVDTGLKNSKRSPELSQSTSSKGGHKTDRYKWVSTKKPRPEPQGCDCPDSGQDDGSIVVLQNQKLPSERTCSTEENSVEDKTLEFCQEVDKKCQQLKPSMDKVLSILGAEIRKQKSRTKKRKDQCNTDDKHSMEAQIGSEVDWLNQGNPPETSRTKSAKPGHGTVTAEQAKKIKSDMDALGLCSSSSDVDLLNQGNHPETSRTKSAKPGRGTVTAEQTKKIKSDMDVLGLCSSGSDEAVEDSAAEKSTVRDNYFDYGRDVDPTSMKPAKYAPAPDSHS